jgi:hypothetical protein
VFDVPYPTFYRQMLAWVSIFELDMFSFMPIGCAMDLSFYHILVTRRGPELEPPQEPHEADPCISLQAPRCRSS